MFRPFMFLLVLAGLAAGPAQAETLFLQDNTANGSGTAVVDTQLRGDSASVNNNLGISPLVRPYPDDNSQGSVRHELFKFDLSGLSAGWTIDSATLGLYFMRQDSTSAAVNDYKLSLIKNDWIEGTKDNNGVVDGEPTFMSRKHNQVPWNVAGATGLDTDIVSAGALTFNKAAVNSEWITLDATAMVDAWVNQGQANNGVLLWGGVKQGSGGYWSIPMSEYATTNLRPYLSVQYTIPEPAAALLLAAGLPALLRRGRKP